MLTVKFHEPPHESIIIVPMLLFNSVYENEWFQDERVLSILRNIDKVEYIGDNLFKSELFGYIPAEKLSTGSKTLLLMLKYNTGMYYQMSNLGDNCFKELAKIQDDIDVKIWVDCLPKMRDIDLTFVSEEENESINNIEQFIYARVRNGWK